MLGNLADMRYQVQWQGNQLVNLRILVHEDELDIPQRQLGSLVLPPDPVPVKNARPEQYYIDEYPVSTRITLDGRVRVTQYSPHGVNRIVTVPGNLVDI